MTERRSIANPERGCGTLKRGKAYVRGVIGSADGVLPSFVELDPHVPYREMGTEGSFTRGYLQFDGVTSQFALDDLTDFVRRYPDGVDDTQAQSNMVDHGLYCPADGDHVPAFEGQRHVDRVRARGVDDSHFGGIRATGQTDLLMRAGKTHYPDPQDFIDEAIEHGISKAIPVSDNQTPPVIEPGVTRCWIVHPDTDDGWAVIGYAYLQEVVFTEPADGHIPQYIQDYQAAGRLDVVDIEPADDGNARVSDYLGDQDQGQDQPDTVVPSESGTGDVQANPDALLDAFDYNELKRVASTLDLSVGQHPSANDLAQAIDSDDVTPDDARGILTTYGGGD